MAWIATATTRGIEESEGFILCRTGVTWKHRQPLENRLRRGQHCTRPRGRPATARLLHETRTQFPHFSAPVRLHLDAAPRWGPQQEGVGPLGSLLLRMGKLAGAGDPCREAGEAGLLSLRRGGLQARPPAHAQTCNEVFKQDRAGHITENKDHRLKPGSVPGGKKEIPLRPGSSGAGAQRGGGTALRGRHGQVRGLEPHSVTVR